MTVLFGVLWPLQRINDLLLAVGRWLAIAALGIMVCLILSQIFFRYVLDSPLNWTEEAARFGMLWMTGLMAPLAYRMGGFVAIDMAERGLGRTLSALLTTFLLAISLAVIIICLDKGINNHVDSLTGRGKSSSLRLPLDWFGGERTKFRNAWMFSSLVVGFGLMLLVNIELLLRQIIKLFGHGHRLKPLRADEELVGAS
ncbi:MAG: TRAP transporter small permease [Paracoccaceae bacterium]|nr:TRAP transporter small permease [Paracoccaceae bacterium]